jgi:hypothetical protein
MTNGTREQFPANFAVAHAAQGVGSSLDYRLIDDSSECNFLDNRNQKYQY